MYTEETIKFSSMAHSICAGLYGLLLIVKEDEAKKIKGSIDIIEYIINSLYMIDIEPAVELNLINRLWDAGDRLKGIDEADDLWYQLTTLRIPAKIFC